MQYSKRVILTSATIVTSAVEAIAFVVVEIVAVGARARANTDWLLNVS